MYTTNSKKRLSNCQLESPSSSPTSSTNICSPLSDISNNPQNGSSPFKKKLKQKNDNITLQPLSLPMELGNILKNSNFLKPHKKNSNDDDINMIDNNSTNNISNINNNNISSSNNNNNENFIEGGVIFNCDQELGEISYARPDLHPNSQSSMNLNDSMVPDNISNSSDSVGCNSSDINFGKNCSNSQNSHLESSFDDEIYQLSYEDEENFNDSENDTPDHDINTSVNGDEIEDDYIDYNNTIVIHPESPIFPWISIIHEDCIELTSRLVFNDPTCAITKIGNDIMLEYTVQYPKTFYDIVSLIPSPGNVEKFKMVIKHPGPSYEDDLEVRFENSNLSIIIKKSFV